jgi:SAM-dependent methyltransferase
VTGTPFVAPPGQDEAQSRMDNAHQYNAWLLARGRPWLGRRILDAGAGLGTFVDMLPATADVVAVEPDPAFAQALRERFAARPRVRVVETDLDGLAADPQLTSFDTIVCFNVLEHVPDDEAALATFTAKLRPGGHLLLIVPAHPRLFGEIDRQVGHERRYERHQVRARLSGAGLEPIDVRYVNPVGALGWLVSSVWLRRPAVPGGPLTVYDRLVPLLRPLDRLPLPFGLSVWSVARRPENSGG